MTSEVTVNDIEVTPLWTGVSQYIHIEVDLTEYSSEDIRTTELDCGDNIGVI